MKRIFTIAAMSTIIFGAACNNAPKKPLTSEQLIEKLGKDKNINTGTKRFVVNVPKGWTTKDTTINGVKFHFLFPPEDVSKTGLGSRVNVNILNESMQNLPLDVYMEKTEQTMAKYMQGFKKIDAGDIDGDGVKGKWLHYYAFQNNIDIECIAYIFPSNDGIAYIMTGGAHKGDMANYRATFDEIAKSFKFTN